MRAIQQRLDHIGITLSLLCSLHCLALPFFLSFAAGQEFISINHWLELCIFIAAFVVAISSLLPAYFRHHHRITAIAIVSIGFMLLLTSHLLFNHHFLPSVIGGLLIASGHFINNKLKRDCLNCQEK